MDLNSGAYADFYFRYLDPDNYYAVRLDSTDVVSLLKMHKGQRTKIQESKSPRIKTGK